MSKCQKNKVPKAQKGPKESKSTESTESEKGKKRGHKSPEILLTRLYKSQSKNMFKK